ncbi:MAG: Alanine racemase [Candidatus Falkowbacteria bacterium GW2011_GWA2_39_24]|uniref:Alanine racemase n=1 Tax=Candidatus Falkowbacteria bacterium GW2011_GWA2_39_24 TaxID=1618634 RepID=A0A0G0NE76_9BACT|nr:MAG: Alanine racemase [Candidatus Falkowbacteria bacterium GW2011_GWA2_39_24]
MNRITHNNLRLRTWLEIDKKALAHNYQSLRKILSPGCQLMAVAKSNAYGHSLIDYSQAMQALGVDWLGVDSIIEAVTLRKNNITVPILVLGYTFPELVATAIKQNISLLISSFDSLQELVASGQATGLKIHLKFDTGMSRQGFSPDQAESVLQFMKDKLPSVIIEGVCTHLAGAKNPAFPESAQQQLSGFEQVLKIFSQQGLKVIRHASATSGAIVFPESHYDLVRIGIGLYGLWPSPEVKQAFVDRLSLQPSLTWKTIVAEVKTLLANSKIGYDWTETVSQPTKIAVLPIGYWHGYDRSLSSKGCGIIKGQLAKVLGRVSMDMIVVDISQIDDVKVGEEVILIGQQGLTSFSAEAMAELAQTTNYEIVTRLNPLIKRIYK